MRNYIVPLLALLVGISMGSSAVYGQTGNIAGQVTEAQTGDPLPGVNVVVDGTTQGATTDADGYYRILNVAPGTYTMRATFVGYAEQVIEDVRVNIDLTTNVDIQMQEEAVGLDEVVVQSEEPVVKPDISANIANISAEGIENIPAASIDEIVGLQAGVEPGLSIRGGGQDELSFMVDGLSMRTGRTNAPFTGVSYTAVEEIQVQTGGFNAEYGNVRSGLINVVTKEGPRDHYTVDVLARYSPAQREYFGSAPNDPNAYYMRPYLDDEVAWEGTDNWDRYTQQQYLPFEGWNAVSDQLQSDDEPSNDLTPQEAQEVFRWRFRKPFDITDPDYELDASIGGPIPVVSQSLGDLRFFASYRQTQEPYVVPQVRSAFRDRMGQVKLTSNVSPGMKVNVQGLHGVSYGLTSSSDGNGFRGEMPPYPWSTRGMVDNLDEGGLFGKDEFALQDITNSMAGISLTHTLGPSTFYEVDVQRMYTDYFTRPGPHRDTVTVQREIGPMQLTEYPYGWQFLPPNKGLTSLELRSGAEDRDTSNVAVWSSSFDITSQITHFSQMKAGLDFIYSNYDITHGEVTSWLFADQPIYRWERSPVQGAAYAQNKLEFEGLIANVGIRLDYFDAGDSWYAYSPFSRALTANYEFAPEKISELEDVQEVDIDPQLALSPRLGVSFPVTENSKLFFNYGHFRQMLEARSIFEVGKIPAGKVEEIGNPNHPMPQTISYELGYEQNLFNQLLLRLTGYYKDVSKQPRGVNYTSIDGQVNYVRHEPYNYEDVRGFEVSLSRNTGRWMRGFFNYTFMARKTGNFGLARRFEHLVQQREFRRQAEPDETRPIPEPFARINIEFFTPAEFGPDIAGRQLLGDWHLNWLGEWRAGQVFTWRAGADIPELNNNVRWRDYYNLDLRLSKNINTSVGSARLFVDVSNVLNLKHLHSSAGFQGPNDFEQYMMSLHLPENAFEDVDRAPYEFIPGDDRPGDYRDINVDWVPIEIVQEVSGVSNPHDRPLYYEQTTRTYMQWSSGSWQEADADRVEQVLDDKAYIDMPNQQYFRFLNPRRVMFGLRVTL